MAEIGVSGRAPAPVAADAGPAPQQLGLTQPTATALTGGMPAALAAPTAMFSRPAVETAAVRAAAVRKPDRIIPRATILGTIATAVVYLLSLTAVFGIVPAFKLAAGDASLPLGRRGRELR